jgi:hypothetical protein
MSTVQRIDLSEDEAELIEAARGTNEAFTLLEAASGNKDIPIEQAVEVCKRIAEKLPRE